MDNYKTHSDVKPFIQDVLSNIDMSRQILIFAQQKNLPQIKARILKKILQKNLGYLMPDNCCQENSFVSMNFTSFNPKFIGQINNFFFLVTEVTSFSCHPVTACLYFNSEGNPVYTLPTDGNTFNPLSQKPYGMDEVKDEACLSMTGKTMLFTKGTKADMDKIISEFKSDLEIPECPLIKHSLDYDVSGIFEFTLKEKKRL